MSREQVIELLKQYKLAEIIAAVQEAYRLGYKARAAEDVYDDNIPF